MGKNSVSFQMLLILLSLIALSSESQISVFKQWQSSTQMSVFPFGGGGGGECTEAKVVSVKKNAYGTWLGSISRVFH